MAAGSHDERAADVEAWLAGEEISYAEFARKHGVSPVRARQIMLSSFHRAMHKTMQMPQGAMWLPDDWPIDRVPLSTRTRNALLNEGIKTVGEVRAHRNLLLIPEVGPTGVQWLKHVTATDTGKHGPVAAGERLEKRVKRLEAENTSLRIRLQRIIAAARREAADD